MTPQLRPALVVLAIFLAGGAVGFAVHSQLRHGPPPPPHGMPPYLRELSLTGEQEKNAEAIFERHRTDVDALMRDTFPKVRARNEQMEKELRAILTPEQAAKLDEIRAHRPPPGPGGPHGPGGPPGFGPPPPPQ